jgi:hypothetical protein
MPTATYIALANLTLTTTDSEIIFSSIPNTYRDLVIVVEGTTNASNSNYRLQFNSDTGSNYTVVVLAGTTTPVSNVETFTAMQPTYHGQWSTSTRANTTIHVMDYSATDKRKTMLVRNNRTDLATELITGVWANTSAITSIRLFTSTAGSSFASGTTFSLFGIVS